MASTHRKKRRSGNSMTKEELLQYYNSLSPEDQIRFRKKRKLQKERRRKRRLYRRIRRDLILFALFVVFLLIILGIKKMVTGVYHHFVPQTTEASVSSTSTSNDPWANIDTSTVTVNELFISGPSNSTEDASGESDDSTENSSEEKSKESKKGFFGWGSKKDASDESTEAEETDGITESITISNIGDCTLGTDENFAKDTSLPAYYDSNGAAYFFENVTPVLEADDITAANLEGTFTDSTARAEKTFCFKADASYVDILKEGSVETVNVANNHSHDYGAQSYTDTLATLSEANIPASGYDMVSLVTVKGIKVGFTGFDKISKNQDVFGDLETNIAALRKAGADIVIVNFHWGTEHSNDVTEDQVKLAHEAIDLGADLVIGAHPHVLQGYEEYNGKYIAYSLGNFCFGGNKNPSEKETMIFQVTFNMKNGTLADTVDADINVVPCSISSTSDYNDYKPTLLLDSAGQSVLEHLKKYNEQVAKISATVSAAGDSADASSSDSSDASDSADASSSDSSDASDSGSDDGSDDGSDNSATDDEI